MAQTERTRILIAEDETVTALDTKRMLEGLGYDVVAVASSGEEAVTQAAETRPNLLLMDIRFPRGVDGIEAVANIRQHGDVPAVFVTAYGDEQTLERAKGTAPFGYVLKPFGERELRVAIETALERHRIELELKQRVREVTALNNLFRKHQSDWLSLVDSSRELTGSLRTVVQQLNSLADSVESWPIPNTGDIEQTGTDGPGELTTT